MYVWLDRGLLSVVDGAITAVSTVRHACGTESTTPLCCTLQHVLSLVRAVALGTTHLGEARHAAAESAAACIYPHF
jgi:hypothetical protein